MNRCLRKQTYQQVVVKLFNRKDAKNAKKFEYPPNSRKLPTGQAIPNIEQAKKRLGISPKDFVLSRSPTTLPTLFQLIPRFLRNLGQVVIKFQIQNKSKP